MNIKKMATKETQELIDKIIPDQYSAIGKLHQIGFTFEGLKKNCHPQESPLRPEL